MRIARQAGTSAKLGPVMLPTESRHLAIGIPECTRRIVQQENCMRPYTASGALHQASGIEDHQALCIQRPHKWFASEDSASIMAAVVNPTMAACNYSAQCQRSACRDSCSMITLLVTGSSLQSVMFNSKLCCTSVMPSHARQWDCLVCM